MSVNAIPSVLINAKVYNSANALLGIGDAELGDLEYMTESVAGLGVAGELDLPVLGHMKSLTLKLKWNSVCPEAVGLLAPRAHQLAIYASIQNWQFDDGTFAPVPCRVSCRATPKKTGIGKFEPGKKMEPESEFELTYLKMSINGSDVVEIDKMNFICMIRGSDFLADVRAQLGM